MCGFPGRTGGEQLACAQEADGEPHDGGLVQVSADAVGQRQLVGQVVEHLRLFAAPTASRIARLFLSPLRAAPANRKNEDGHTEIPQLRPPLVPHWSCARAAKSINSQMNEW